MKKTIILLIIACLSANICKAQTGEANAADKYTMATNSFWSNWYIQGDINMALQNPCNYDFSKVFPNGKTLGIDVAVGKWFTPGIGVRGRVNWSNFLGGMFENHHLTWIGPMGEENIGINRSKGGFASLSGDIQFDIFYFTNGYEENRRWHLLVYPRMGAIYNFAVPSGSPLVGGGIQNLYRLNDKWSIYVDMAYQMMSSGFAMDKSVSTGTGSNSNGYFDISIGVQYDLGTNKFKKL